MAVKPKPDKAKTKALARQKREESRARRKQFFEAFRSQRREDKILVPAMVGAFLLCLGTAVGIGFLIGMPWPWVLSSVGMLTGVVLATSIFGRRVQRSVYTKAEGRPGAAGWALNTMRGQWRVSQGVAGNSHLDTVHRVVGRPGVILVAEGAPHRVKLLLAQEKKRVARVVGATPIYDFIVGNDGEQVPLKKLQNHLLKLPNNIDTKQVDVIEGRLAALNSRTATMPKGPLPPGAKIRSVHRSVRRR